MLTLRSLHYFMALVQERHFGRAAARVNISQPALSMQIKELERALNVALVERTGRELQITPAGREVADQAQRILVEVAALEQLARSRGLETRLNLGVIPTVAPYLLPSVLPALRAVDIRRDLRLREATTDILLAALEKGTLDAVVIAWQGNLDGLDVVPLFEDRFLLAGRRGQLTALMAREGVMRPVSLDPDQLLLLDEGHCLADQALEVCGLDRRGQRLDLGASSLSTLCGLVGHGLGLTFLPEIALAAELATVPAMAAVRFSAPEPSRQIVLARRKGRGAVAPLWFEELAMACKTAGQALIMQARNIVPVVP
jgi:LysR family transcriptional regulator, hydrogen peroxide-inducible genes activator